MSLPLVEAEERTRAKSKHISANNTLEPLALGDMNECAIPTLRVTGTDNHRDRLSHLLSVMPAGVLVIDHKGRISLANQQAESLLEQHLVGQMWRDLIVKAFAPRADDGHEVSMRNGKRVKIQISALTQEKGQLVVITDLTETRQLQNRLSHLEKLSSLGKMMASLAHQVRTPLSSALLYAENLRTLCDDGELAEKFSGKLLDRLKELESQVNDMLLFAKKDNNQVVSKATVKQLNGIAHGQAEELCKQHGVMFSESFTDEDANLMINPPSIKGAINNLVCNAIQACKKGNNAKLKISTQITQLNERRAIEIKLIDNGSGIDEEKVAKIF
ncbi:MAG: histidine kinase dimerization/phospho-acceptor domain-containing protein, partial [Pseudomonadota bacterium]